MSAWRVFVKELYVRGPQPGFAYEDGAIQNARTLGLIERLEDKRWQLTPLGVEYCQGRVEQREVRPGGRYFAATWLRSLPQDIRI